MSQIIGYRVLSQIEIDTINAIKLQGEEVGCLINSIPGRLAEGSHAVDARWLAIAKTHLQEGFMALTRSVAKPEGF